MISINDYTNQSYNPHLVKGFVQEIPTEQVIRKQLSDNLSKGLIDQDVYDKAIDQLDDLIKAKTGEGSRGGHVIGHTKSGKPVYAAKNAHDYKDFTAQDHRDASMFHDQSANKHRTSSSTSEKQYYNRKALMRHHNQQQGLHVQIAHDIETKQHEASLSPDEKKILADQRQKQIDHHEKYAAYYSGLASEARKMSDMQDVVAEHQQRAAHHQSEKERLIGEHINAN